MSALTYDVVVVGAGIIGAACADECTRQGLRVAIIDRDAVGSGATATGMGHIVVMDDSEAQFVLTRYSQQLWQELRPELPADVEYQPCGTIWVAADEEEMAEVRRKEKYYGQRGVTTEVLDPQALQKLEPNLRQGLAGGLLVPEGCRTLSSLRRELFDRTRSGGRRQAPSWHFSFTNRKRAGSPRRRQRVFRGRCRQRSRSLGVRPYSRHRHQEAEGPSRA